MSSGAAETAEAAGEGTGGGGTDHGTGVEAAGLPMGSAGACLRGGNTMNTGVKIAALPLLRTMFAAAGGPTIGAPTPLIIGLPKPL